MYQVVAIVRSFSELDTVTVTVIVATGKLKETARLGNFGINHYSG